MWLFDPVRDFYGPLYLVFVGLLTLWVRHRRGVASARVWAGTLWLLLIGPVGEVVFAPAWEPSGVALYYGPLVVGAAVACASLAAARAWLEPTRR
jgi:hypothetical protein